MALIAFNWAWLTWLRLASRQAGPKSQDVRDFQSGTLHEAPGYFGI
jgi:hypothetical protein